MSERGDSATHTTSERAAHVSEQRFRRTAFDRFAERAAQLTGQAWFFTACVLVVLIWAPSKLIVKNTETWQLLINSATTIVTFLLVALLQNTQRRSELALHEKLNALARGIEDILEHQGGSDPGDIEKDIADLRKAVGLEREA